MPTTQPVTSPDVLQAVDKAFARAGVRKLTETQRMVLAGVLAVFMQEAHSNGVRVGAALAKQHIGPDAPYRRLTTRW